MDFTPDEIEQANNAFLQVKKELDLPQIELTISPYRPVNGQKGDIDKDGRMTVYSQKLESFRDLVNTIRHEMRHEWQRRNFPKHYKWWKSNMQYYADLKAAGMLYAFCTIEADAEQFAVFNNSELQGLLERSEEWLEDKKNVFYRSRKNN